jgi:PAS domain S-box-containing protein
MSTNGAGDVTSGQDGPTSPVQLFFEAADLWLAVADADLRLVETNPAWRAGFAAMDRAPERLDDVLPKSEIDAVRAAGASGHAARRPMIQGPDGRWLEVDLAVRGGHLLVAMIEVAGRDVNPDVEAARRSRDLLLQDATVGAWRYDPLSDCFNFAPEISAPYGEVPKVVPRMLVNALVHRDDLAREAELRERITREGGSGDMEMRMRRPDGAWHHLRVHLRAGRRLAQGAYEMYGLTQQITELAEARDEARRAAERLRIALGAAHAAVFELDYVQRTFEVSPEFEAIFGFRPTFESFEDGSLFAGLNDDDRETVAEARRRWSEDVFQSVDVRTRVRGRERWVRVFYRLRRDEAGQPLVGIGLLQDIDERKRQELELDAARRTAEAATAAKSAFLASVSHEIRTPMNGIVGVLHLLKSERLSASGRALLDEALACSGMLGELINDVLDLSKIEAGRLELHPEPADPAAALDGVLGLLKSQADAKGLTLAAAVQPDLGWVSVDPTRLRQCLFNLIGNAVKFTTDGGVQVSLARVGPTRLACRIKDTGPGITEADQARLFGRFEQTDEGVARGGAGLGLAISRSLAQLMGGDIRVESTPGEGATFTFEFEAPSIAAPAEDPAAVATGALEGLRVLLVDDNPTNRMVGARILEALGATAVACDDGASAVEAVSAGFDVVLMDINMPGMDGMEATRIIRALPGPAASAPIIALTANVMTHQRQSYLAAGMDGVVAKPFSPASLLAEICAVLDRTAQAARAAAGA